MQSKKLGAFAKDFEVTLKHKNTTGANEVLPVLLQIFDHLFTKLTENAPHDDLIRMILQSSQLGTPISLRLTKKEL